MRVKSRDNLRSLITLATIFMILFYNLSIGKNCRRAAAGHLARGRGQGRARAYPAGVIRLRAASARSNTASNIASVSRPVLMLNRLQ